MEISDYEKYYQKGGTYVLPIEVFNELWGEVENWKDTCKQKDNIIKDIKAQLDYLETYSSKEDVFEDMKRRLDRIKKIIGENNE